MEQERYCAACGNVALDGDRFCRACGAALGAPPASPEDLSAAHYAPQPEQPVMPPPKAPGPTSPPPASGKNRRRQLTAGAVGILVVGAVAVAVILGTSGNGGGKAKSAAGATTSAAVSPPAPQVTQEQPPPPDPSACETKGIIPLDPSTPAGKCKTGGTRFTVANQDGILKTKTMIARFSGSRQADSLSDPDGFSTETANGTFVVVTVDLTNRLSSPVDIGSDQSALILRSGKQYDEAFDAENGADQQSFLWQLDTGLQPDESRTGDFVFDLPSKALRQFQKNGGALVIAELGSNTSEAKRVGVIRLSAP
jgi:hypothetical protein